MKKNIVILLCFAFTTIYAQFSGGAGTIINPYQISTKADLKTLSENAIHWDKNFIQTANITFNHSDYLPGGDFYNGGNLFITIGGEDTLFTGSYNGQNFTIDSLQIYRPLQFHVGFLGAVESADITNVHITNGTITGESNMGGVIGAVDNSHIDNISYTGVVTCVGSGAVGGAIGYTQNSTVSNSYSIATVVGASGTGGFIGANNTTQLSNSYSNSTVTGTNSTGGFVGYNSGTINECSSSGSVNGNYSTGGFAGWTYFHPISNSYTSVEVTGTDRVGGFAGTSEVGNIINCYSSGNVIGSSDVGGFVGLDYLGIYDNDFWNTETSGQLTTAGNVAGINSLQMQTLSTFTDSTWDFIIETTNGTDDIWQMGNCETNNAFPIFSWQTLNPLPATPTINASGNTTFCDGGSVTINSTIADNYLWSTGDTSSSIIISTSDTVYLIAESNQGCLSDTSNMIIIAEIDCSGIDESENHVTIYPNPSSDYIFINTIGIIENISLYDALGKFIGTYNNQNIINISHLNSGIYIMEVKLKDKKIVHRVIKN